MSCDNSFLHVGNLALKDNYSALQFGSYLYSFVHHTYTLSCTHPAVVETCTV